MKKTKSINKPTRTKKSVRTPRPLMDQKMADRMFDVIDTAINRSIHRIEEAVKIQMERTYRAQLTNISTRHIERMQTLKKMRTEIFMAMGMEIPS